MEAIGILREQMRWNHDTAEQAVADLSPDQLHHRWENSTIESIAAVYAHMVMAEDWLLNRYVRNEPTLFERDGWSEKVKMPPMDVRRPVEEQRALVRGCDFEALRAFAQDAYAATDDFLASLSASDLDRTVTFGSLGEMPLGKFLALIVSAHSSHHAGEICAMKGLLGQKGLPY